MLACFCVCTRSYPDLAWRCHNVPITHRVSLSVGQHLFNCLVPKPRKRTMGVATGKKSRVKVSLGWIFLPCHQNVSMSKYSTHQFYTEMLRNWPFPSTWDTTSHTHVPFQHGHAAILSRAQEQPTSTNKLNDCLPGPFFIQGSLDAFVARGNWSGAWRGKSKIRSIDLGNCRGGSVGFTRGDKSEKRHFIGGSNARLNSFYVYIVRGDKGRKMRKKIAFHARALSGEPDSSLRHLLSMILGP